MSVRGLSDERVAAGFRDAEAQSEFWKSFGDELSRQYPDQFVAVIDGRAVAAAPDLQQLLYAIRGQGVEPSHVWVRFMASHPRQMIL